MTNPLVTQTAEVRVIDQESPSEQRWESLVSSAMEAREAKDNAQWIIGDIAAEVEKMYGSGALVAFAQEISVNKNTFRRYKLVSQAFPEDKRIDFLSHRHHMMLAAREDRFQWLQLAADNNWSTDNLKVELGKYEGTIDEDFSSCNISFVRGDLSRVTEWYQKLQTIPGMVNEADTTIYERLNGKLSKLNKGEIQPT